MEDLQGQETLGGSHQEVSSAVKRGQGGPGRNQWWKSSEFRECAQRSEAWWRVHRTVGRSSGDSAFLGPESGRSQGHHLRSRKREIGLLCSCSALELGEKARANQVTGIGRAQWFLSST